MPQICFKLCCAHFLIHFNSLNYLEDIPRLVYLLQNLYYSNFSFSLLDIMQYHDYTQTINMSKLP